MKFKTSSFIFEANRNKIHSQGFAQIQEF